MPKFRVTVTRKPDVYEVEAESAEAAGKAAARAWMEDPGPILGMATVEALDGGGGAVDVDLSTVTPAGTA